MARERKSIGESEMAFRLWNFFANNCVFDDRRRSYENEEMLILY